MDITLYRDDIGRSAHLKVPYPSQLSFSRGASIWPIDDVLWAGRTIRAALETLRELGQPVRMRLVVTTVGCPLASPYEKVFVCYDLAGRLRTAPHPLHSGEAQRRLFVPIGSVMGWGSYFIAGPAGLLAEEAVGALPSDFFLRSGLKSLPCFSGD